MSANFQFGLVAAAIAGHAKLNAYHVSMFAKFVERLRSMPDGDGSILDHVLIYKGTNMGNSHRHAHEKVPVELIGRIDGSFKGEIRSADVAELAAEMCGPLFAKTTAAQVPVDGGNERVV